MASASDFMLLLGCALLAFGPFLSLFSLIVYRKAQLVIVVTTSAFFFLLGSLAASLVWFVLDVIGLGGVLAAILPGVFFQFMLRCGFVALYHRVEAVIQTCLDKQHEEEEEEERERQNRANDGSAPHSSDETDVQVRATNGQTSAANGGEHHHHHGASSASEAHRLRTKQSWTEAARLRLQLNDASCGIAAGVGFGGMHAIMLFGTLLASEASHGGGVLYQQSCPSMPSLAVSAMNAFCFTVLDVFWMLFTFFGMRRRLLYHRGEGNPEHATRTVGGLVGDSRNGGNVALLITMGTHLLASMVTLADYFPYGCRLSLPLLGGVVLMTAYVFWAGVGRIYMPPNPTLSQLRMETRSTSGSVGGADSSNDALIDRVRGLD